MKVIILIQRFSKNIFRTKQLFAARIFLSALAALVLETLFTNSSNDPSKFKLHSQMGFFCSWPCLLVIIYSRRATIFLARKDNFNERNHKSSLQNFISCHIKYSCFPSSLPNCGPSFYHSSVLISRFEKGHG